MSLTMMVKTKYRGPFVESPETFQARKAISRLNVKTETCIRLKLPV